MNNLKTLDNQPFTFGTKLKKVRKILKLTQKEFGAPLKIGQDAISDYENEKYEPLGRIENSIIEHYNINPIWWETGKDEVFLTSPMSQKMDNMMQESGQSYIAGPRNVRAYIVENLIKIPLLEINARAGFVDNLDNYTEYVDNYISIEPERYEKYENALAFAIDGDSMEPELRRGDVVLSFLQEKSEWEYLNPGIYAIVYRNSFTIKRIKRNTLQSLGMVELLADNEIFGSLTVKAEDIRAIWKVSRLIKRQLS